MESLKEILKQHNKEEIGRAGARYTPACNKDAPNIEIKHLLEDLDFLVHSPDYLAQLNSFKTDIEKSWSNAPKEVFNTFRGRKKSPLRVAELLNDLASDNKLEKTNIWKELRRTVQFCKNKLYPIQDKIFEDQRSHEEYSSEHRSFSTLLQQVREILSALSFYDDDTFDRWNLINTPNMLLLGEWGKGKTHFLCDITLQREEEGFSTLLILARDMGQVKWLQFGGQFI